MVAYNMWKNMKCMYCNSSHNNRPRVLLWLKWRTKINVVFMYSYNSTAHNSDVIGSDC